MEENRFFSYLRQLSAITNSCSYVCVRLRFHNFTYTNASEILSAVPFQFLLSKCNCIQTLGLFIDDYDKYQYLFNIDCVKNEVTPSEFQQFCFFMKKFIAFLANPLIFRKSLPRLSHAKFAAKLLIASLSCTIESQRLSESNSVAICCFDEKPLCL